MLFYLSNTRGEKKEDFSLRSLGLLCWTRIYSLCKKNQKPTNTCIGVIIQWEVDNTSINTLSRCLTSALFCSGTQGTFCSANEVLDQSKNITLELFLAAVDAENLKCGTLFQFLFWYSPSWNWRHAVLPILPLCDPVVAVISGLGDEQWERLAGEQFPGVHLCQAQPAKAVMYAQALISGEVHYRVSYKGILCFCTSAWKKLVKGGKCNVYVNSSCVT